MSVDKRRHERLSFQGTIFIELVSPGMGGHDGEVVMCKTIDISRSGLRVGVNRQLTAGAILQIGVELSDKDETLYLAGEVKWCGRDDQEDDSWLVGFELMNANDSDIEAWRAALIDSGVAVTSLLAPGPGTSSVRTRMPCSDKEVHISLREMGESASRLLPSIDSAR